MKNLKNDFEVLKKSLSNNKELLNEYESMVDNVIVLKRDENNCETKTVKSISVNKSNL